MAHSTLSALRPLWRPVYLPSLAYAAGASILAPVQVLLPLRLGLSEQGVAALVTFIGAFSVVSSLASGHIVDWWGEARAVVAVSAMAAVGLCTTTLVCVDGSRRAGLWCLVGTLCLVDVADAVWSIARQELVADLTPAQHRGLAMNLYGACQRLGRMVGPLLASALLLATSPAGALPAAAIVLLVAALLLNRSRPTHHAQSNSTPASGAIAAAPGMAKVLLIVGLGALVLSGLRSAKESLVPLWAAQNVHLSDSTVSLVASGMSAMELVLFLPAGLALDRIGRTPVVVAALTLMGTGLLLLPAQPTGMWLAVCTALVGLGDGVGAGIVKTLGTDLAPATGRARFLGRWQAVASGGALAAPALAAIITTHAGLGPSLATIGAAGLAAAAWMAWCTPRYIPRHVPKT